jgi:pimeloyl-ACP methyl ester carboxylesterase
MLLYLMLGIGVAPILQAADVDPPRDAAHPSKNEAVWVPSHGVAINGVMLLAPGLAPHPTALLIHGLPGNEQNLDLAQALRRQGFNVLTFHFRGSWGSPGAFSMAGGVEDSDAALKFLEDPANAATFHIDLKHLVVIGHSYGGFCATRVATNHPELAALVLLAPWDPSETIGPFRSAQDLPSVAHQAFDDVDGRLGGVRDIDLARELLAPGFDWRLASHVEALKNLPLLLVTATDDTQDDQGEALSAGLKKVAATKVTASRMTTDHPFSDHRIALQALVSRWLKQSLGGT